MRESKLRDAFLALKILSGQGVSSSELNTSNARLPKIAESLPVDRLQRKPVIEASLIEKWHKATASGTINELSAVELRRLAWEPTIALKEEYLDAIEKAAMPLRRSSIKGLVYALLCSWNTVDSATLVRFLKKNHSEANSIPYLAKVAPYIISIDGADLMAKSMITDKTSVQNSLAEIFGISASATAYADAVLNKAIEHGYKTVLSLQNGERRWFYNEILAYVNKETLLRCLEKVVAAIDGNNNELAKEEFKRFVLFHPNLGDPRLPGYEGNWPKDKLVTTKVIEWLSQSDIRFFFELFIEEASDEQGRKQFWLQYAHLVKGTRVILSKTDRHRRARQISQMTEKSGSSKLFGELKETSETATAFMMDFGNVVIVEFSQKNHACYYYEPSSGFQFSNRGKFWDTAVFSTPELKSKTHCPKSVSHHDGWEVKLGDILTRRFGIRPRSHRSAA